MGAAPAGAAAGVGAAFGGAGAAAGGAATGAGAALAAAAGFSPVTLILKIGCPALTVVPSATNNSSMIPCPGDGTGTDVLSVSISAITSSSLT